MPSPHWKRPLVLRCLAVWIVGGILAWSIGRTSASLTASEDQRAHENFGREDLLASEAPTEPRAEVSPALTSSAPSAPGSQHAIQPPLNESSQWTRRYEQMSAEQLQAILVDLRREWIDRKEQAANVQWKSGTQVFDRLEDGYLGEGPAPILVPRIHPETQKPQFVALQEHRHPELYRIRREIHWVDRRRSVLAQAMPPRPRLRSWTRGEVHMVKRPRPDMGR